ncbi:bifunctional serine/threonine-protein kinase/formylglycine-generating enzyme family protein [Crocosphaera chwakensis]|uniref:non-specific serine/threonine protein kinase n=1 Tax=Crocosphaera chwakensis CCY0110 TaxID=391612 RepID=A3IW48_9CHRO|nr:bifunctional serine/threonine-protein kinase/formylglycine-generating enzyme family protein [Crocosphaera chwakensis]EAZ89283.1 Serine/Threonine protein kinase [Crocosphaera chwakensis CCY0110]
MTLYCLNPTCPYPDNPNTHNYCQGCGQELSQTTQGYLFRDRYFIKQVLGEGNFGRTYLVEDQNFHNRKRVLKKFIANFQGQNLETAKELFKREANILDTLKHEQIPAIYDHFEDNNSLYLVEEYIEGEDLVTEFNREGKFSEEKIKSLLQDILPVLDYLHQRNLLHRDIKPDNLMRRRYDSKLILIDFGGVKEVSKTRGTLIYTPGYASVEQMTGHPQPTSDIYSLGVTCVRLLTGCFPENNHDHDPIYDSSQAVWLWQKFLEKDNIKISNKLSHILNKMLEHLAQNRYHNVQEILDKLQESPTYIQPAELSSNLSSSEQKKYSNHNLLDLFKNQKILFFTTCSSSGIIIILVIKYLINPSSPTWLLLWEPILNYAALISLLIFLGSLVIGLINIQRKKKKNQKTITTTSAQNAPIPKQIPSHSVTSSQIKQPSPNSSNLQKTTTVNKLNKKIISSLEYFDFEVVKVNQRGKIIEQKNSKNQYFTIDLGHNINLEMVVIPGGNFFMGSPKKEGRDRSQERPQHQVRLASFCMSKYPITQAQWERIMNDNPSQFKGQNKPVDTVSFYDSLEFCNKLSEEVGINFYLPSEAQWEYACRSIINPSQYRQLDGIEVYPPFHFGDTITQTLANYNSTRTYQQESIGIYRQQTTEVGSFPSNAFGLYDMHGNVWEWCGDDWHETYENAPKDGRIWLDGYNEYSPMRGGSWAAFPFYCRCGTRSKVQRNRRSHYNGFRVVYNFKKKI